MTQAKVAGPRHRREHLGYLIDDPVKLYPDRVALIGAETTITYAELDERSDRVAAALVHRGVQTGDRVALLWANHVEYVQTFLGVLRAGGVAVPLNARLGLHALRGVLTDAGAVALLPGPGAEERAAELAAAVPAVRFTATAAELVAEPGGAPASSDVLAAAGGVCIQAYTSGSTDARAKLRGEHRFPSDERPDGALWVLPVRAPHPHARLTGIDVTAARAVDGAVAVLTAADVPGVNRFGLVVADQPVLCDEVVRHAGDVVAVVAAESRAAARTARDLVEVSYEPLPLVTDLLTALDAHPIHSGGNLCAELTLGHGDVDAGFAAADVVVEYAYRTGRQEHAFLETEAGVSYLDPVGRLTVCAGGQHPTTDRRQICAALGLGEDAVRVLHPMMGGAFGGKEDISVQILLALVTHRTGRPARLTLDRVESLAVGTKRHPFHVRFRVGATAAGELIALQADLFADTGAYATLGAAVLGLAAEHTGGPYRFRSARIDARVVHTNNGNCSAFRGFGNPQVTTGIEQVMDMLAERLGIDPVDLRRRNALRPGDRAAAGFPVAHGVELAGVLDSASTGRLHTDGAAWKAAAGPGRRRGIGLACAWQGFGLGAGVEQGAEVWAEPTVDGFRITVGCPDLGQGNRTAFAQLAAEALDCPVDRVELVSGDSDGPESDASNASRTTFAVGNAVAQAAALLAEQMRTGTDPARVVHRYRPEMPPAQEVGYPHIGYTPSAVVVGVEVDEYTGEVDVHRLEHHLDPGRVVDAGGVRAQSEGAIVQGLGFTLLEDTIMRDGRVANDRFGTYLIPSVLDVPAELETVIVSTPDPSNPLGVRGVGEIGITPVAAAVGNALHDALGRRFSTFPITPDAVLGADHG